MGPPTISCPKCGTQNAEGAKFCADCGTSLKVACAKCGAELKPGTKFCADCGTPVSPAAAAAAPGGPPAESEG